MIVFLYRPSPQVPKPTAYAARQCVEASIFNITMQREQIAKSILDLTWIFTQSLFMALNAILWAISYPEIRKEYSKETMEKYIDIAQEAIQLASQRWPGVESALELYQNLIVACLKAYDGNSETSYVVDSSSSKTSPASFHDNPTPPPMIQPYSFTTSPPQDQNSLQKSPPTERIPGSMEGKHVSHMSPTDSGPNLSDSGLSSSLSSIVTPHRSPFDYSLSYEEGPFDPSSMFNAFPQAFPALQPYPLLSNGCGHLGSVGEQYSQYLQAPYVAEQPVRTLNQEEQMELMKTFENTPIDWG